MISPSSVQAVTSSTSGQVARSMASVFHNICAEQWHHPDQFAKLALAKVELLNASGQQGYAFDARGDVCVQMGQLGKKFGAFIAQRTVQCEAGVCPKHP